MISCYILRDEPSEAYTLKNIKYIGKIRFCTFRRSIDRSIGFSFKKNSGIIVNLYKIGFALHWDGR